MQSAENAVVKKNSFAVYEAGYCALPLFYWFDFLQSVYLVKKHRIHFLISLFLFFVLFLPKADALDFKVQEKQTVDYVLDQSKDLYARSSILIEKALKHGVDEYVLTVKGEGRQDNHKDVNWIKTSRFVVEKEKIKPLRTIETIRTPKNEIIVQYSKEYDYKKGKVSFLKTNNKGRVVTRSTFSIKGPICDNVTLPYFLRYYAAHLNEKGYEHFYVLTNEGQMQKVVLKNLGVEVLTLSKGSVKAQKIEVLIDLGFLADLVIQNEEMYFWFSADGEYRWLQYEKKEAGAESISIRAFVK